MAKVTVDVGLDDFDDEEILEASVAIVQSIADDPERFAEVLGKLRAALYEDPGDLPPRSTAAMITTIAELRAKAEGFAA